MSWSGMGRRGSSGDGSRGWGMRGWGRGVSRLGASVAGGGTDRGARRRGPQWARSWARGTGGVFRRSRLALAPGSVRYFVQTQPSGGPPVPRIHPTQDIRPLGEFRANLAAVVAQVRRTKRPVILTQHGRSAAVLKIGRA